jgi:hypothetical protein
MLGLESIPLSWIQISRNSARPESLRTLPQIRNEKLHLAGKDTRLLENNLPLRIASGMLLGISQKLPRRGGFWEARRCGRDTTLAASLAVAEAGGLERRVCRQCRCDTPSMALLIANAPRTRYLAFGACR